MTQSNQQGRASNRLIGPLLSVLVLAPLAMAPRGCTSGTVEGDCAVGVECNGNDNGNGQAGSAGSSNADSSSAGAAGSSGDAGSAGAGAGGADVISCGGLQGKACPSSSQYCDFPQAARCGAADQTGSCLTKPQLCTELFAPVCGCNGKTYSNSCFAAAAGESVQQTGACADDSDAGTPQACGGLLGVICNKSQYCDFAIETKCGNGDQMGSCETPPQICPDIVDPVCGCDGKTYVNSCRAAAAGTSVKSAAACSN